MNNPYDNLPAYIKETTKFSKFLGLMSTYLVSATAEISKLKDSFLLGGDSSFVVRALAAQLGVKIDVPFVDGEPDLDAYFKQLFLAYRARLFVSMFRGDMAGLFTGDLINDKISLVVLDFSVDRPSDNKTPMTVVYSALSMDSDLNLDIVRDHLVPKVTGVNASLYFLQFGQDVFGYDIDQRAGIRIGPNHVDTIPITGEDRFSVLEASINAIGTGYAVGDVVVTDLGVQLRIKSISAGATLGIEHVSQSYANDPAGTALPVTGGSGSGMTVDVVSGAGGTYYIRGFDNGSFISISRRLS